MSDQVIATSLIADDQVSPKVKDIKRELKEAQADVVKLSDKFGATSKQAAEAAKKAADLKDRIGDAKSLIDAFNPDTKFRAFGASINTVVGGFSALTGAMGLLGVESENVQKTLLKVQSALAISQGVAQLQEGIQSFKNLGAVLVNTLGKSGLMGIAIAGVVALGAAFLGVFNSVSKLTLAQKQLNEVNEEALKDSVKQRTELKLLYDVANNVTLSTKQRMEAVKALQKEFPGYFDNIKTEKDLNDKLTTAYNNAAQGILNKAKATATFNKIVENENKILKLKAEQEKNLEDAEIARRLNVSAVTDKVIESNKKKVAELEAANKALADSISPKDVVSTFSTTPGGKASTPGGKAKETELKEVSYIQGVLNKLAAEEADREKQLHKITADEINIINKDKFDKEIEGMKQVTSTAYEQAEAQKKIDAEKRQAFETNAAATANALGALSELFGKEAVAGKILAIAQATINTYLGASKAIAQGGFAGIAQAVTVIAAGIAQVKRIVAVKIPGKASPSQSSVGVSAPLTPSAPGFTSTRLDQNQINQIGNATQRAFVLEHDVATNSERIRRLNRAARLG